MDGWRGSRGCLCLCLVGLSGLVTSPCAIDSLSLSLCTRKLEELELVEGPAVVEAAAEVVHEVREAIRLVRGVGLSMVCWVCRGGG